VQKRLWLSLLVVLASAGTGALSVSGAEAARSVRAVDGRTAMASVADFDSRLFARTNARRARHGCRPLRLDASLVTAAEQHGLRMVAERDLSHQLPGELPIQGRAVAAGYTRWRILAENLAWGQTTPAEVFRDWVRSPEHRANLDNCRLRDVGISTILAAGRPWVTEDFGRRYR